MCTWVHVLSGVYMSVCWVVCTCVYVEYVYLSVYAEWCVHECVCWVVCTWVCVFSGVYVSVCGVCGVHMWKSQTSDSEDLKLQVVVSPLSWVLRTKFRFSGNECSLFSAEHSSSPHRSLKNFKCVFVKGLFPVTESDEAWEKREVTDTEGVWSFRLSTWQNVGQSCLWQRKAVWKRRILLTITRAG